MMHAGTSPGITVTKPHACLTWCKGMTYKITWEKQGTLDNKVKIRLYNSTSTTKILDIATNIDNSGSYGWTIPATVASGSYRVRVKTMDTTVFDALQ